MNWLLHRSLPLIFIEWVIIIFKKILFFLIYTYKFLIFDMNDIFVIILYKNIFNFFYKYIIY